MVKKVSAPTLIEERKCWALGEKVVVDAIGLQGNIPVDAPVNP